MASAIIKWKPIQINTTRDTLSNENEMLAVYHGLAICAEGQLEQLMAFISTQHFQKWVDDLVYLFRRRPSDAESFILVFETISLTHFPGNLVVED
jgi:hypothetical protein